MVPVKKKRYLLVLLVTAAALLRGGFLYFNSGNLSDDHDAYRSLAHNIAIGKGYVHPATNEPTAYRPPLYPLILSVILYSGGHEWAIGMLQLALGIATVVLTWWIGKHLRLGWSGYMAAGIVAADPLLLQYSTLVMSETLGTFLVTLLMVLHVSQIRDNMDARKSDLHNGDQLPGRDQETCDLSVVRGSAWGCVLGLCVLCRPAIWGFAAVMAAWWLCRSRRRRMGKDCTTWDRLGITTFGVTLVALAVTVSPWLIRNMLVFGRPILTTTHGGYTLLLGNNPVFYREVVAKPWGTVWDDAGADSNQPSWYRSLQNQMTQDLGESVGEVIRDQWMHERAWQAIRAEPTRFTQACGLRFLRIWNVMPLGPAATSLPRVVLWGIVGFYLVVDVGLVLGLCRYLLIRSAAWTPIVLLVGTITIVHLFYWANMRMRAPLVPAIALLTMYGWTWPCRDRCASDR